MAELDEQVFSIEDMGYVGNGRFDSPLPNYPGHFTLAYPFFGRHYKAWLRATREEQEGSDEVDNLTAFKEWRGFCAILDVWAIEGVPKADVTPDGDDVPESVKFWARTCLAEYLASEFDPKGWRKPRVTS